MDRESALGAEERDTGLQGKHQKRWKQRLSLGLCSRNVILEYFEQIMT